MSADFSLPFPLSQGNENIREVLGFFHHQISQLSKDVALINRRVADLCKTADEQNTQSFAVFVEASNKRLDGFAASIQSVTDELIQNEALLKDKMEAFTTSVRNEFNEKLAKLEVRVNEIQHKSDNSRVLSEMLEVKLNDVGEKTGKEINLLHGELAALRNGDKNLLAPIETKPRPYSRNSAKKAISRPVSATRRKRNVSSNPETYVCSVSNIHIFDCGPKKDLIDQMEDARNVLRDMQDTRNMLDRFGQYDKEFQCVHDRLDKCALKSELFEIIQGFVASGAEGVVKTDSRVHMLNPSSKPVVIRAAHSDFGLSQDTRQTSAHVKLINGDCLRRPVTTGTYRGVRLPDE